MLQRFNSQNQDDSEMEKSIGGDMDSEDDEPPPLTFKQSILSIIPFTKEYKTAQKAFEMLDNLKRIQIEKAKAVRLSIEAKTGHHEKVSSFSYSNPKFQFLS
jgi:hypothetical protein